MRRADAITLVLSASALLFYVAYSLLGLGFLPAWVGCPTKMMLGIDCPLCGLTRAGCELGKGNLSAALHLNFLSVLIFPGIFLFIAHVCTRLWDRSR